MKHINKIHILIFVLLVSVSFLQCRINKSSDCNSNNIQLLFDDVLRKQTFFPSFSKPDSSLEIFTKEEGFRGHIPVDSSMYFNYLYSSSIKIPNKMYYLHWSENNDISLPDSVKLIVIKDPLMKDKYSNLLGIEFLEVNEDTTKLKLYLSYSMRNNINVEERTFSYSFNKKNCLWTVLDSTIVRY